jgi:hypothetical protein
MELKELLGDLFTPEIEAKVTASGMKILVDSKNFVPLSKLDEANEKVKLINERDNQLKELKKSAAGNTDLQAEIQALQETNKQAKADFDKKEIQLKKDFAIKEALLNAGVDDIEARNLLSPKFQTLELDSEGKLKGFDEALKPVKENKAFSAMFGKIVLEGNEHNQGNKDLGEWASKNPFSKKTLNIYEQIKLKREQPELAKKLEAAAN